MWCHWRLDLKASLKISCTQYLFLLVYVKRNSVLNSFHIPKWFWQAPCCCIMGGVLDWIVLLSVGGGNPTCQMYSCHKHSYTHTRTHTGTQALTRLGKLRSAARDAVLVFFSIWSLGSNNRLMLSRWGEREKRQSDLARHSLLGSKLSLPLSAYSLITGKGTICCDYSGEK